MFKFTIATVRPDKSAEFWHRHPDHGASREFKYLIKELIRECLVVDVTLEASEDDLTLIRTVVYESEEEHERTMAYVYERFPDTYEQRDEYNAKHGHYTTQL